MTDLKVAAKRALSLMDLTSLNSDDTDEVINKLCFQAKTPEGEPAAVCVYPAFVKTARKALEQQGISHVKVATVTNFPAGSSDIVAAVSETRAAVSDGADEIDVVFPYRALIAGDSDLGFELVRQCKAACGETALLKVIIETGELKTTELIELASTICIQAGADFIKTSTGKVPVNATPAAAEIILRAIKGSGRDVGFKAAGGVRNAADAAQYIAIAEGIMGKEWVTAEHFRFGASSLLASLLETLGHSQDASSGTSQY